MALGVGALGVYGVVSALLDGNDAPLPEVDHAKAKQNAEKTLTRIDWNKPIIAMTVAGTGWVRPPQELKEGLFARAGEDRTSLVHLEYPASATDMAAGVALGKETLRLVLDEIRRRDPDGTKYHVALNGESQGAWVINDVLGEQPFQQTVDRAGLYGLPASREHDDVHRDDPRIRVTNHPFDPIAWPHLGPASIAAQAPGFILGGNWGDFPAAAAQIVLNPLHAATFGVGQLVVMATGVHDRHPHLYTEHYGGDGAEFLLSGAPARGR